MTVNFRLPGPTPLPPQVTAALSREMIPHRGPVFRSLYRETLRMARDAHRTDGDVLTWAATGSAGWEVAIVNLLSPGDPVLAAVNGDFGERFSRVAVRLGLDVRRTEASWGEPLQPDALHASLNDHPDVAAVLLVHNETSTGVTNPLQELAAVVRDHGALVIVDAVSAAGALPLETDSWGLDFVFSGSQKAWMCPPGLLIVAVGRRGWDAHAQSRFPRFFWDLADVKALADQGMTPTTPPLSMIYAYHAALQMIGAEGIENVWQRHRALGELTRDGVRRAGLHLLARSGFESNSVTAFHPPAGVAASEMLRMLRDEFGVEAQGGQSHFAEKLIRIGHMGWVHEKEMLEAILAIGEAVQRLSPEFDDLVSQAPESSNTITA